MICVPDTFQVSPDQIAAAECEQMNFREDSIAFMAIPKHAGFYVQTVEIPLAMLEVAAATSVSTTHV
jgi:hypothetical protein